MDRGFWLLFLLIVGVTAGAASAAGSEWEASYPDGVQRITHAPPSPVRGQAVAVTLTLSAEAERPDAVSLLWCRVEPDYVCAFPSFMTAMEDGTYRGTIPGAYGGTQDVIRRETVHVGYNITMRFEREDGTLRVSAPTASPWVPHTFPAGGDGRYYFYAYTDAPRVIPAVAVIGVIALNVALLGAWRRGAGGRLDG